MQWATAGGRRGDGAPSRKVYCADGDGEKILLENYCFGKDESKFIVTLNTYHISEYTQAFRHHHHEGDVLTSFS